MKLRFLNFINEQTQEPATLGNVGGGFWFNSGNKGLLQIGTSIPESGVVAASYHSNFVARNPEAFGIKPAELHGAVMEYFKKQNPQLKPEQLQQMARKEIEYQLSGYKSSSPALEAELYRRGWIRGNVGKAAGGYKKTLYLSGNNNTLTKAVKYASKDFPDISSMTLDVQDPGSVVANAKSVSHSLEGPEDIQTYVENGGKPHRNYSRIELNQQQQST